MGTDIATQDPKSQAVVAYDYGDDAGAGFETAKPGDFKPSFLRVLQANSPQVSDGLPGARAGVWCDSITGETFADHLFVPAVREHVYVAWKPRTEGGGGGQGFGGVFQPEDKMVIAQLAKIEDKFARGDDGKLILPRTPDGEYQLIETVYFHGTQLLGETLSPIPVTLPFSSTGLPVASAWFTTMRRQILPNGKPYPLFAHIYKLGSSKVTKAGNTWFVPTFTWGNAAPAQSRLDPASDIYAAARAVKVAFDTGNAKVDYAAGGTADHGTGTAAAKDAEIPF